MNALFTFLQARVRRREKRTRRSPSPDFTEPSVTITSSSVNNQQQQQQHNPIQNENNNHNNNNTDDGDEDEGTELLVEEDKSLSFLYQLCKRWAWPAVIFRAEKFPEEACCQTNIDGDTLLHWVCFGSPPIDVIVTLLQANPKLAQIVNDRGSLPLHVACSYRASSSVIKALIDVYPESVDKPNNQGSYPLHILCDYGCDIDSIQAILQQSIQSVLLEDCLYCRKPLLILNERKNMHEFHDSLQTLRLANALGNGYNNKDNNALVQSLTKDTLLSRCRRMAFWKKACLLICAEYSNLTPESSSPSTPSTPSKQSQQQPHTYQTMMEYKDDDDSSDDDGNNNNINHGGNESSSPSLSYGIINACLQIQDCPPALLEFAVLVQADEELLSPSRADNGKLPVHIAVQKSSITTILDILNAQRKAARYPHPKTGKFIMQSFLERLPDAPYSGVVDQIIPANPLALHSLPNFDKRLYPLIYENLVVKKDFDSIFESIRGNPPLLFG